MSLNKKATIAVSAVLVSSALLSGCGLFGGEEKEKIDPPSEMSINNEDANVETEETTGEESGAADEAAETTTIPTELYLIDNNGYVVSQTLDLPSTNSVAKQALEYLVVDGKVTELLPNNFRAVLPADTKMTVDVKDKVAHVDFSKEFAEYNPEDEARILQSVTWTLTQFDEIEQVKLSINGNAIKEMPVNGTPIGEEVSRSIGINYDNSVVTDITNTKPVTVYYMGGEEDAKYFVPVTKRVSNNVDNNVTAIIDELGNPSLGSKLSAVLPSEVALLGEPKVEDGTITLDFDESIFSSGEENVINENVLKVLALSLTEQAEVESVAVTVNGEADLLDEDGEKLEPVSRPESVNTGSY
ncbi:MULTISPECIES: GerMN domain-containing protein [Cytobacillus]|uniref:Sporulation protein n=1 Tax=Cytobacillus kochii TaxID=859143 RepID=A0A248TKY5_9BACI|nr:GerMN domain-containing protein [Cytobacillus kochii]ASV68789.1 sporulation protein [Cytobacillus kochii]MDQ0183496.1 germination protein M [Cytobacillus kochii]